MDSIIINGIASISLAIALLAPPSADAQICEADEAGTQTAGLEPEHARAWREDLEFLARELEIRHADFDHSLETADFRAAVSALASCLPELTDDEIILEIARLTARIGDGHTGVFLPWARGLGYSRLPLELYPDDEGYFVLAASPRYAHLAGSRLVRIEETPVNVVAAAVEPLVPRDNIHGLPKLTGTFMMLPDILATLGFARSPEAVRISFRTPVGELREERLMPVARSEPIKWRFISDERALPRFLRQRDRQYWLEYLPDNRTVFVQFNSADIGAGEPEAAFAAFADSLAALVASKPVERLVLDLRWNSGGSASRTRHLLWALIRSEKAGQEVRLFTILGPDTFSAAVGLATELDQHTETLFVGAPPAGRPNAFGDLGRLILPNSGIEVRYSRWAMHQSTPDDHRPTIFPDLQAPLTLTAYRAGVDPAMEAIEAYRARAAVVPRLRASMRKDGIVAATRLYRDLREEEYNAHEFDERDLAAWGYELLEEEHVAAAVAVFRLYVEFYPYSPNAHDSLGDAYRAAGRVEEAVESYERAFAIDKQYSHSRDKILDLREEM